MKTRDYDIREECDGEFIREFNSKVIAAADNILDPETDPTKPRKIVLTLTMSGNKERSIVAAQHEVSFKPVERKPVGSTLFIGRSLDKTEVCSAVDTQQELFKKQEDALNLDAEVGSHAGQVAGQETE